MKKKIFALLLALVMLLGLAACGGGNNNAPSGGNNGSAGGDTGGSPSGGSSGAELTFTTGSDQGTYYSFGSVLAGQISDRTSTAVTAIVGKGSKANIEAMDVGDAQLGFVQSDVMAYAYDGTNLFAEDGKVDSFSTVAALYMEQVQIITLDPSIKTVADLAGKSVSVGESGSGVFFNAVDVLGAYDLTLDDITPTYQSFGDSAEALQDGKIDAAFIVSGAPTTAEHIEKLIAASPYYSKNVIPAAAYGLEHDATTVAVGAVIIARDDVGDDAVYDVVSGIFDSIDTLGHDKKSELSLDFAASVTAVPYHPGAAKYFSEKGFDVPSK